MIDLSYHAKIRLYVPNELILTKRTELNTKQSHYLMNVMRKKIHGTFLVFNHTDGEFLAKIQSNDCLLYTSPSPRDGQISRMPSSA